MSYVEGASLHQERGGATVIARYAFNELWRFIAGWAILLDYLILIALTAFATTDYLGGLLGSADRRDAGGPARRGDHRRCVAALNVRGLDPRALRALLRASRSLDLAVQAAAARGRAGRCCSSPTVLTRSRRALGGDASLERPGLRLPAGDRRASPRSTPRRASRARSRSAAAGCKRLLTAALGRRARRLRRAWRSWPRARSAPPPGPDVATRTRRCSASCAPFEQDVAARRRCATLVAVSAALVLFTACIAAMLGLSRLGYSLARQPPDPVARRAPAPDATDAGGRDRHSAPCSRSRWCCPRDLEFLAGHLRVRRDARLHDRAPLGARAAPPRARPRPAVPDPVQRAVAARAARSPRCSARWSSAASRSSPCSPLHDDGARSSGRSGWPLGVVALRRLPALGRTSRSPGALTVPEEHAHRRAEAGRRVRLDPRAGVRDAARRRHHADGRPARRRGRGPTRTRRARRSRRCGCSRSRCRCRSTAALPDADLKHARAALAHAKAVGEEYEGVTVVNPFTVRARSAGEAIVREARRRGVEAIVMPAEEPTRVARRPACSAAARACATPSSARRPAT